MNWVYDNLQGETPLPGWALKRNLKNCYFYSGQSMRPTFKDGQLIYTSLKKKIDLGDVIVFMEKGLQRITVHRVMAISNSGFLTRGDNNSFNDPVPVAAEQVFGVAECFEKKGYIKEVPKGKIYLAKLKLKWRMQGVIRDAKRPLGFFYRAIKRSGIIRFFFGKYFDRFAKKIILKYDSGPMIKTVFREKTIVVQWPAKGIYICKKPFDLFTSEGGDQ
jgi:signal peptidase I